MSEEILKVALAELMQCVRICRPDGSVIEVPDDIEKIRDICSELRHQDSQAQLLMDFVNSADALLKSHVPFSVEFAVKMKNHRP